MLLFKNAAQSESIAKKLRKAIIIMSPTIPNSKNFMDEIFNNNEDAFYIYEPLYQYSRSGFSKSTQKLRKELLVHNLNCNFIDHYDQSLTFDRFDDDLNMHGTIESRGNFVFRNKHRRLCLELQIFYKHCQQGQSLLTLERM
ncbi:Oidioi.mRNA.OKI2018_I69.PAR.g8484.t1.cds [Oikopleura dioica]|uniref:Oidioi.mRNA.OKI2018_I69.PAR.g8484.t1.cds n=1 Tax=Oikopleura dioica TaxID=34765 RepID=A0ABN7RK65_OIKDI|nr:Oidioi.mRNA.OKI2018_I69.PAR.g8484.t1.cds [Oikopleura dioica]